MNPRKGRRHPVKRMPPERTFVGDDFRFCSVLQKYHLTFAQHDKKTNGFFGCSDALHCVFVLIFDILNPCLGFVKHRKRWPHAVGIMAKAPAVFATADAFGFFALFIGRSFFVLHKDGKIAVVPHQKSPRFFRLRRGYMCLQCRVFSGTRCSFVRSEGAPPDRLRL